MRHHITSGLIFGCLCLIAGVLSQGYEQDATITRFANLLNQDGTYEYEYSTSNGIHAQETGLGGSYASGSAQHYAPDGTLIQLTYTADENGFQPQGDHLPTPPPVPEYILRALEYIRTHPPQPLKK